MKSAPVKMRSRFSPKATFYNRALDAGDNAAVIVSNYFHTG